MSEKKIILCPNPNRDQGMQATRAADAILREMGFRTVVCSPFKDQKAGAFADYPVVAVRDYSADLRRTADGRTEPLNIPKCNCVYYELAGGSFVCVRPSGTEPKLKIYYSIKAPSEGEAEQELLGVKASVKALLDSVKQ